MGEESALIQVRGVERTFRQGTVEVRALRGVDLEVEAGEFSVLAGPSGSGKTTLLNVIGCLDQPTAGSVSIDGVEVSKFGRKEAAEFRLKRIGFVFQAYNLIPVLTAYENAEFIMLMQGVDAKERRQRVEALLKEVGLEDEMNRRPHELSGGQQQRVAVVRAIAAQPVIVLADEPTANLDSANSEALLDLLSELNQEHGVTFLFSSHDPAVIDRCTRVIRLDSGEVVADERKGE
jgi:putative ABC transport system ATP-binding protein